MKELTGVTLIAVDTKNYSQTLQALIHSLAQIKPERTIFLTDIDCKHPGVECIKIPRIKSKSEYSRFIIKELYKYFDTPYCLLIQHDGYVLNGASWNDDFYNYDFIGAPWLYIDDRNVGNGGFSFRTFRLQQILGMDNYIEVVDPEDEVIGRLYRHYLETKYKIRFPEPELADEFSYELRTPIQPTFGFHGYFHEPYQDTVMIQRTGAMGDVIMVEPVLHHFFLQNKRVVLETLPQFKQLFRQHYFKVHIKEELDRRLPVREINLDMAYEIRPKMNHLAAYYEGCGIENGIMRNPKLSLPGIESKENKLFKKYCVLHIDMRPQNGRNIYGVQWREVVRYLASHGYDVIQIGKGEHEVVHGAINMNTPTEPLLMWLIGGADLFIGIDSGPAHIASAFNIPSVLFFGSVDPVIIYPDSTTNKLCIHQHYGKVCEQPFCWHNSITTTGQPCYIDEQKPPCVQFVHEKIMEEGLIPFIKNLQ